MSSAPLSDDSHRLVALPSLLRAAQGVSDVLVRRIYRLRIADEDSLKNPRLDGTVFACPIHMTIRTTGFILAVLGVYSNVGQLWAFLLSSIIGHRIRSRRHTRTQARASTNARLGKDTPLK